MGSLQSTIMAGLSSLFSLFSTSIKDIGIDLGTANTLVYVRGEGIVLREPSVVAVDGVIADFEVTAAMLKYFVRKAIKAGSFTRPHIVICIPSGVTEVERRAVEDAAKQAGASRVELILEPVAAAIGAGLPTGEPVASMVLDIRVAGDKFDAAIVSYLRKKYGVLIGERTAEDVKLQIGSAYPLEELGSVSMEVRGRSAADGQPKNITVMAEDVREALLVPLKAVFESVHRVLERTPPELSADLLDMGLTLTGGGALLRGLDRFLHEATGLPVQVAERPLDCVAEGAGRTLEGKAHIPANARGAVKAAEK